MPRWAAEDLPALHRRALDQVYPLVAAIHPRQWPDRTPCTDWSVRDLLNHVVSENLWVPELVAGKTIPEVGSRFDGDVLGRDPLTAFRASAKAAAAAFESPGALSRPVAISYGPVPGSVLAGHRLLDVVVHGWDLATATGQSNHLDPEVVQAVWELVVEPERRGLRESGVFGEEVPVPADADLQTRLLGVLGRRA